MIKYTGDISGLKRGDMDGFFEGWGNPPSAGKRIKILQNSDFVILAYDGEKLAGFINAISDKTLCAYIPLLEVLPEFRGQGIGRELVKRMIEALKEMYMIDLCCDEKLENFYGKLGMKKISGMIIRNYDRIY